jgi:thymidylate kinase
LRLLVEGCAGSGKTMLAVTLARAHAAQGKSVLLTCFNRALPSSTLCRLPTQPKPIRIKDLAWFAVDFCSLNL